MEACDVGRTAPEDFGTRVRRYSHESETLKYTIHAGSRTHVVAAPDFTGSHLLRLGRWPYRGTGNPLNFQGAE
ncbi:hypothetical protein ElyMa_001373600 [Elysia marginata]|uniref:Uncharacterized protein n=1 Tax=Elysia marginata TaxID=1093978 RepID=A0AAV4IT17_9GAST|nr:hypothetical protein ElyMa_001373600 [Elysia marginata]